MPINIVPTIQKVGGNVASASADIGNPVKVSGVYNSTLPTFTNGQRADMQLGLRGALNVQLILPNSTTFMSAGNSNQDNENSGLIGFNTRSYTYAFNGSSFDRMRGDVNGLVTQTCFGSSQWTYAAASGGITNSTTAVTIKAAAGANVRNYLKSMQIYSDALGAATELVIRDGAGGTVLWRGHITTAGLINGQSIVFDPPLRGTANTLMEVATLTASVTGSVYVNAQGYVGS